MPAPERPLTPSELDELERLAKAALTGSFAENHLDAAELRGALVHHAFALIAAARRAIELEGAVQQERKRCEQLVEECIPAGWELKAPLRRYIREGARSAAQIRGEGDPNDR